VGKLVRDTEHMKRHLFLETEINEKVNKIEAIEDPFITTTVTVGWNFWDWFRMLFEWNNREVRIRVKVRSDPISQARWFKGIDLCENCKKNDLAEGYEQVDMGNLGVQFWCKSCKEKGVNVLERILRFVSREQLMEVRGLIGDNTPLDKEMVMIIDQEMQSRDLFDDQM